MSLVIDPGSPPYTRRGRFVRKDKTGVGAPGMCISYRVEVPKTLYSRES